MFASNVGLSKTFFYVPLLVPIHIIQIKYLLHLTPEEAMNKYISKFCSLELNCVYLQLKILLKLFSLCFLMPYSTYTQYSWPSPVHSHCNLRFDYNTFVQLSLYSALWYWLPYLCMLHVFISNPSRFMISFLNTMNGALKLPNLEIQYAYWYFLFSQS